MRLSTIRKKATAFLVAILAYSLIFPAYIFAKPQGGQVVAGQADITNPSALNMQINQATQNTIINWQQFNIAAPEAVNFTQPNAAAIALNRVIGVDPSVIYGSLTANGGVWVINPAGILVGSTGVINVNSFLASTLDILDDDFMSGNYTFTQRVNESLAAIVNQGTISVASGGNVSLIAPGIVNQGTIVASLGKVNLGAGEQVTLNFQGNELINFAVDKSVLGEVLGPDGQPLEDSILNEGTISAEGGEIVLSARTAYDAIKSVVNNKGVIEAQTVENNNGVIRLQGNDLGIVYNSGTLDVSGVDEGETGGEVEVTGEKVGLVHYSKIKASGHSGGGKVLIGGDFQGKNPKIVNAKRTYVGKDATIEADAIDEGEGGEVIVWADEITRYHGNINARGGTFGGNGGFVEVSGKQDLVFDGFVDTSAPEGQTGILLLDPLDLIISDDPDGTGNNGDAFIGGADGTILFTDLSGSTATISAGRLEALTAGTDISMRADNSIIINNLSTNKGGTDNELTLSSANFVEFRTGAGGFSMNAGDTINVTGNGTLLIDALGASSGGTGNGTVSVGGLQTTSGGITIRGTTVTLNGDINSGGAVDIATNVTAITLAAGVTIDNTAGTDAAILLADVTGDFTLGLTGDGGSALALDAVDVDTLNVTAGVLTLNDNVTADTALDLKTNVASITLAANSTIDTAAGGVDQGITLADVTGDFTLGLTGDAGSALALDAVDVDTLNVTGGVLTLNDNVTVDTALDLKTNVASITLRLAVRSTRPRAE